MPIVTYKKHSGKDRKFNCWRVHYIPKGANKGMAARGGKFRLPTTSSFLFVGGATNNVPENVWEYLKENPDVKRRLASGELVIWKKPQELPEKPGDPAPPRAEITEVSEVKDLLKYEEGEALAMVENTMESSFIRPWLEAELGSDKKRPRLVKAMENQIKRIAEADSKLSK